MRELLKQEQIDSGALESITSFHKDVVTTVRDAVQANPLVIVGMAQNPVVKKARKSLDEKGIEFKYLEFGNYFSMWKPRLAIKLWSGWPTFPQVFFKGKLIGGNDELQKHLALGKIS